MTRDQKIELFLSNYSTKDLVGMLLDRMTDEEIQSELDSFEAIQNDPSNSELPTQ